MNSREMIRKIPARAAVRQSDILCPRCGRLLAKAHTGAQAHGLELWCGGKGCKMPVVVELP